MEHSSDAHIFSVILKDGAYSLECVLAPGMQKTELATLKLPFETYGKEQMGDAGASFALVSNLMRDEMGPIVTGDFDTLYLFVGSILEEVIEKYDNSMPNCISIGALVKTGKVTTVFTDFPTAGWRQDIGSK